MHQVFSVETKDGDETKSETAILYWVRHANPYHALHKLGVEYALSPAGVKVRCTGLTFAELLNRLTPEMLAPYGLEIIWPEREAVTLGAGRQIVSTYEIQSHLEARERERQRNANRERRTRETAERYARKLERLKADGHPVLSGWDAGRVCNRAVSWACQYVRAGGSDADGFLEKKLADAVCKANSPQDAGGAKQENIAQTV